MFPIIRVDSRRAESLEQLGTKRKFWFRDHPEGPRLLFKAEERGTGDDWAEKLAAELAGLIGLPHVEYRLALDIHGDVPGVVCETCSPAPIILKHGNQLLVSRDPNYPEGNRWRVRQHTVDAVAEVLAGLGPPPEPWCVGLPQGIESALDTFTGYIMLDAWIANQDRHHENWAALVTAKGRCLAPTFDHGASMARNITDDERRERLASKDRNRQIDAFARRARSALFADPGQNKAMPTHEAWYAFARLAPDAAKLWIGALRRVDPAAVDGLIDRVPPQRMSGVCREFTRKLLATNRQRLLDGEPS